MDGISGEVWKFGEEEIVEWIRNICNRIWKKEGWLQSWKKGVMVSISQKGGGKSESGIKGCNNDGSAI